MNNLKILIISIVLGFAGSYYHHQELNKAKQVLTEQFNKTLKPISQSIYTRGCEDSAKTIGYRMFIAMERHQPTPEDFNEINYRSIQFCKTLSTERIKACENNPNNPNLCLPGEQ